MSTRPEIRQARRDKHDQTHNNRWTYEEQLFALAGDMLDKLAPRPSQQVPTSGHRLPYPAKGRPATTHDRYVYDTGE